MPVVEVTEPAAERIRELLDKDGKAESHGLRMQVVGGGCSGLRYELAFDDQVRDIDTDDRGRRRARDPRREERAVSCGATTWTSSTRSRNPASRCRTRTRPRPAAAESRSARYR